MEKHVLGLELPNLQINCHEQSQSPVEQQKVDEEFLAAHLQPVLAADEGETHIEADAWDRPATSSLHLLKQRSPGCSQRL